MNARVEAREGSTQAWGRSLVAGVNALFRMAERGQPEEARIVDDPHAAALGEGHLVVWMLRGLRHLLPPLGRTVEQLRTAHCVRHGAIDQLLGQQLDAGSTAVLLLGAGYDMRALRLDRPGVRWFEVDQPAILARKARAGPSPALRIAHDLSRPGLAAALVGAGWDPTEATVIVLEGVVHYLPREGLQDLLAELCPGGPRSVILSFIRPGMVRRAPSTLNQLFRAVREIPRTWYEPEDIAEIGARFGLLESECFDFEAQVRALVPQAAGRPVGVSQEVARLR